MALFCVAAATDYFDGAIARRFSQETSLGAQLDAAVDKIFIYSILLILSLHGAYSWSLVAMAFSRDAIVEALRCLSARRNRVLPANRWGKLKFVFQCISVAAVLVSRSLGMQIEYTFANGFLALAIILSLPGLVIVAQSAIRREVSETV